MEHGEPEGVYPKMRGCWLRSGVTWQGALQQKRHRTRTRCILYTVFFLQFLQFFSYFACKGKEADFLFKWHCLIYTENDYSSYTYLLLFLEVCSAAYSMSHLLLHWNTATSKPGLHRIQPVGHAKEVCLVHKLFLPVAVTLIYLLHGAESFLRS